MPSTNHWQTFGAEKIYSHCQKNQVMTNKQKIHFNLDQEKTAISPKGSINAYKSCQASSEVVSSTPAGHNYRKQIHFLNLITRSTSTTYTL